MTAPTLSERLLECAPAAEAFGRPDMAQHMREAALELARLEKHITELRELSAEAIGEARYLEACQDPGFRGEAAGLAKPAPFMGER